jgi:hypothetical protein
MKTNNREQDDVSENFILLIPKLRRIQCGKVVGFVCVR